MANDGMQMVTPKLRFPEFRDDKSWHKQPLRALGDIVTGKTPSTKDESLWGGFILFITPTDISDNHKYQYDTQRTIVESDSTKVLPVGSIVYTCIASIGKMAITQHPSVTNQQINSVIPNAEVNGEFVYYALANLTPWIKSIPATSTLPIINKSEFSSIEIGFTHILAEQQKIADCLTSLDEVIAAQGRKVEALKAHKKGLMQQLFPREGETLPRLRFPEFRNAAPWQVNNLDALVSSISNGLSLPQSTDNSGIKVTRIETISASTIDLSKVGCVVTDEDVTRYRLQVGDILLSNINSVAHIGKSVFIDRDYDLYHGMNLLRLVIDEDANSPRFVFFSLNTDSTRASLRERANKAVNQASINQTELGRTVVFAPLLAEQQKIAKCLTSLDEVIAAQGRKLEALKAHKKGLMQQLFPSQAEATG